MLLYWRREIDLAFIPRRVKANFKLPVPRRAGVTRFLGLPASQSYNAARIRWEVSWQNDP